MGAVRVVLWAAVALAAFLAGGLFLGDYLAERTAPAMTAAPLGDPFELVDHEGRPATEALFREKPSAVFFGFTHCPDVCPTALFEMARLAEDLGPDAERMRFVFVTVDPERDTPEIMKSYVEAFSDEFIGLTGDSEKVAEMLRAFGIYSRKVSLDDGGYTMDHTASVFLLDEGGALVGTISRGESHDDALAKLRRLVAT